MLISLFTFSAAIGDDSRPSPAGEGIGLVFGEEPAGKIESGITNELSPPISRGVSTPSNISESQLVGLYIMQSFIVYYDSGSVIDSKDYQFMGDMAITSQNVTWQRIAVTGIPTIVASGPFFISGDTITVYNDLVAGNSVLNFSWDGTYLTTRLRNTVVADPFTEVDVWKRVLSSSDQDNDGVVDERDECPSTPLNSCVDNKGCPSSSVTKVVVVPLF